ncbi:haloacid dehalogenase superfamily, subfamily IA, variant 3 with third motif having DD or ED/haloacid dehalogenase superfamily, subfamily IA, variant 1 with third motif having Dx(3-4)D or Dx(3-4)E [Paramicrobacterium humi]|uniref:Haloacid dehalogenase superfamily, subfamily IA, variant 3 with third motif having DD or ED/haloacid dehalogenase superfamily, subfamily IA, variant 1 with third motif having Dx(3-4)D or Dx(3-4)E n=1 Tax=Paramicrobacterium humi TaxID=640635 RepID=A0A1H4JDW0_9MICO|nr:HAD family hydrolase [Microbacterium humi]SEB44265.1 haloacid dehalogenase superfamily, subfamily IA, variant 3 with third motif having DD or ED/haloacid dehalogenase superfamily, subfamily IA, variant 1 with third motif having Dx(3-4)D or Dx(3-4)E [Microbacterium humi]
MVNESAHGAALFDIDGTLVDSNYLHVEAWSHAFAEVGVEIDEWRIHRSIGMDGDTLLETLLGDAVDEHADTVKELHSKYYRDMRPRLRAFDGARDLLRDLSERDVDVVLATSAQPEELGMLREVLDAEKFIAQFTASSDVKEAKPRPDIFEVALQKVGAAASASVVVGDTVWDVEAASRAGLPCIGVLSGGVSRAELDDAGAVAVYADVAELHEQLEASPLARLL